jgi:hypothetical protein
MRVLPLVFAAAIICVAAGEVRAAPLSFGPDLTQPGGSPIVAAHLVCDPSRCIDPRTGAYTQSGCDARGCYPISGVVGYTDPSTNGYGNGYGGGWRRYR